MDELEQTFIDALHAIAVTMLLCAGMTLGRVLEYYQRPLEVRQMIEAQR
jgi:hypothetical protein